jgi:sulfate transport system ATP-binding protein
VFDHPANAFVMDFLGNVNVFQGRVQSGKAVLGGMEVAYPDYPHHEPQSATVYVRPHELEIDRLPNGPSSLQATVLHINAASSVARVQLLASEFGLVIHVDVSLSRYAELELKVGDTVYVSPRRVRVFVPDYAI